MSGPTIFSTDDLSNAPRIRPPEAPITAVEPCMDCGTMEPYMKVDPNKPVMSEKDFYAMMQKEFTSRHATLTKYENPILFLYTAMQENAEEVVRREMYQRIKIDQTENTNISDEFDRRYKEAGLTGPVDTNLPIESYLNLPNYNGKDLAKEAEFHNRVCCGGKGVFNGIYNESCDACMALMCNQRSSTNKKRFPDAEEERARKV